jgi:alpha-D-ribose 1-methylphosphonate 5-triphosphate synthase subunit PhnG
LATVEAFSPKLVESGRADRQAWLGVLAQAAPEEVAEAWAALEVAPEYEVLRPPETGLVMVRGRAGGTGGAFNLGEMTATRAVVRLKSGETGVGYVSGRDKTHALTAAVLDALMQTPTHSEAVRRRVITPLAERRAAARMDASRKAAATRVEFFTMVRDRGPGK